MTTATNFIFKGSYHKENNISVESGNSEAPTYPYVFCIFVNGEAIANTLLSTNIAIENPHLSW